MNLLEQSTRRGHDWCSCEMSRGWQSQLSVNTIITVWLANSNAPPTVVDWIVTSVYVDRPGITHLTFQRERRDCHECPDNVRSLLTYLAARHALVELRMPATLWCPVVGEDHVDVPATRGAFKTVRYVVTDATRFDDYFIRVRLARQLADGSLPRVWKLGYDDDGRLVRTLEPLPDGRHFHKLVLGGPQGVERGSIWWRAV
jgi:hypothetical protein